LIGNGATFNSVPSAYPWGRTPTNDGGEMGGGCGAHSTSAIGGVGGIVVEWFYD
jgi:nitrate/nitrite transporter NarK